MKVKVKNLTEVYDTDALAKVVITFDNADEIRAWLSLTNVESDLQDVVVNNGTTVDQAESLASKISDYDKVWKKLSDIANEY